MRHLLLSVKARSRVRLLAWFLIAAVLLCAGCGQVPPEGESSDDPASVSESLPQDSSDSGERSAEGTDPSEETVSDAESGQEETSEQDVPEDSEAPSFPDARSGFLPALTQKAGERPDLTDIRVEDNQAAQDEISVRIVDDGGYDPDVPGTYTLLYRAEDPAGNAAEVSRLVTVQSKTAESSAPVSDPPSESSGSGDKGQTENEEADVMIYAAKTPFSRNESGALKYTSSGTSFRTKDRIQIMDSDFFLSEYDACAAGHTNNGGIPFFPNGVLIVADRQYRIRQMRIAAGDLFQIDEKGNVLTDGLTWTNTIDASSGGGLFKGLRDSLSSLIPKGGYLIFCGNYGDQACRRYLIRQFLVSDYESGAIKAGQIDVPKKARTVGWTDKDPGGSGQTDPGGSGQTDPPASAEQRLISAESAMQGFQIYEGTVSGEAKKPSAPAVFDGAWYRKAVSAKDAWTGIEATVTLPTFQIRRYSGSYNAGLDADPNAKNLDNPSVYLGGKCKYESDIGLSLSLGLIKNASGGTSISKGSVCFRPFWRYITKDNQDAGGYDAHGGEYAVSANGNNCIGNYHYRYTEYYYLPGDTLRIMVFSPEENKLQFAIQVISVSTLPSSVETRRANGWKDPADFVSPVFYSPGYGTGEKTEFKRVCAIDQSGNEGKEAIPTESEVTGVAWKNVYLYRWIDGQMRRVPMTDARYAVRNAPDDLHVTARTDGTLSPYGGETVNIHPGYEN